MKSNSNRAGTLVDLLRIRENEQGDTKAFGFLDSDGLVKETVSYADLAEAARRVAAVLHERGAVGERVLIVTPPGRRYIEWFLGCIFAGVIPVPSAPPTNSQRAGRMQTLILDARVKFAVGGERQRRLLSASEVTWLDSEDHLSAPQLEASGRLDADNLAFLQYTSGSTSDPKGVMVPHSALMSNLAHITEVFRLDSHAAGVSWLPPYHDMGLIGGILVPIFAGFPMDLLDPVSFARDPLCWIQAISKSHATISGGPNSAFELAARELVKRRDLVELDLSSWTTAFVGAEPIRMETLKRFATAARTFGFDDLAFRPCYGLAEATLMVTCASNLVDFSMASGSGFTKAVNCGPPMDGVEILIVDHQTSHPVEAGSVGEIWVRGPNVAAGYWKAPGPTTERFFATPEGGNATYLRTGDLGFLTSVGDLVPTGRLNDKMIIRGRNVYPQDIEAAVRLVADRLEPGLAASFLIDDQPTVILECSVPEGRAEKLLREIRDAVLAECDLRLTVVVLVRLGTLPRTSSGKVQRSLAREWFLAGRCHIVATLDDRENLSSGNPMTARLRSLSGANNSVDAAAILAYMKLRLSDAGFEIAPNEDPAIFALGLDSLFLMTVITELDQIAGTSLDRDAIWRSASLGELAALVMRSKVHKNVFAHELQKLSLGIAPARDHVPLSGSHFEMWMAEAISPGSTNVWVACEVDGLEEDVLVDRIRELVARHDAFRLAFQSMGDFVVALPSIPSDSVMTVHAVDGSTWTAVQMRDWMAKRSTEAIDLAAPPLLRAHIIRRSNSRIGLLLVSPHIVLDFQSIRIIAEELITGSFGGDAAEAVPYYGFLSELSDSPSGQGSGPKFDEISDRGLALPFRRHLLKPSATASEVRIKLSRDTTHAIRNLAAAEQATPLAVLLSLYVLALHKHSGREWVTVGVPELGRFERRFKATVGMVMRHMSVSVRITQGQTIVDVLRDISKQLQSSWHGKSISPQNPQIEGTHFETVFAFNSAQGTMRPELALFELCDNVELHEAGITWRSVALTRQMDSVPLTVVTAEQDGRILIALRYLVELYDSAGIQSLIRSMGEIAEQLLGGGTDIVTLGEISLAPKSNMAPSSGTIISGLRKTVEQFGSSVALKDDRMSLTYDNLWSTVSSAAGALIELGVQPGDRVGILHRRDTQAIVVSLAILRAGAAFVHLDVGSPVIRLQNMVDDANLKIVVTCSDNQSTAAQLTTPFVASFELVSQMVELPRDPLSIAEAYISFTSGSSGRPKGVIVSHGALVVGAHGMGAPIALGPGDVVCGISPFGWDIAVADIAATLLRGATLAVSREENEIDGPSLSRFLERHRVTVMQTTPQRWRILLRYGWAPPPGFRAISGGDSMTSADLKEFHQVGTHVWNFYGPTEATFWATCFDFCDPYRSGDVPIGRALTHYRTYVLDDAGNTVPHGAVGELFIGGSALAEGYVGLPRNTAERFLPDPFSAEPGARMYRTGDLVRWREDVGLSYIGRSGSYVKLRGYRVELSEIESVLASADGVRDVVVEIVESAIEGDESEVAAFIVPQFGFELNLLELNRFCAQHLPQYMIPTKYAVMTGFPISANGKIDRVALQRVVLTSVHGDLKNSPSSLTEGLVLGVFQDVLGSRKVDVRDDFFLIGGYSLRAMQVASRLSDLIGKTVNIRDVFVYRSAEALAKWLDVKGVVLGVFDKQRDDQMDDVEVQTVLRGQQRLWITQELTDTVNLGMPILLAVGNGDAGIVKESLRHVVDRHSMLRSTYSLVEGILSRLPCEANPVKDVDIVASTLSGGEAIARVRLAAMRELPWRLDREPPVRLEIINVPGVGVFVALVVHHIAFDGWSGQILLDEFAHCYERLSEGTVPMLRPLVSLDVVLAHIAFWETDESTSDDVAYFVKELIGTRELSLPVPPENHGVQGGRCVMEVGAALDEAAQVLNTTPLTVAVAAFAKALGQLCNETRIVLGLDVANRVLRESEAHVGYFANQVPLVVDLAGANDITEITLRASSVLLGAIAHSSAPYDGVIHALRRQGWSGERLFTAKVVHQPLQSRRIQVGAQVEVTICDPDYISVHDPLSLWVWENERLAVLEMHYRADFCGSEAADKLLLDIVADIRDIASSRDRLKEWKK